MQTMNYAAVPQPQGPEEPSDLGFGTVVSTNTRRLLNQDGSFNVRRIGLPWSEVMSLYHAALVWRWPTFFGWTTLIYLGINLVFALAYMLCGPNAIGGANSEQLGGVFGRAFFFSVETFATIGYGNLAPRGAAAHLIMTAEALVGLLAQALITGMFFARFARPTAAVTFARKAVIAPFSTGQALMIRMVNRRKNELIEAEALLTYSFLEQVGNQTVRRYRALKLERGKVTFFPLAWTIVHPITPDSPIWGLSAEQLAEREAEFLLLLSGQDDTFATTVHARTSYKADEVVWGAKYTNIFEPPDDQGVLRVDISRLDEIAKV